jgi:hypothetical protein
MSHKPLNNKFRDPVPEKPRSYSPRHESHHILQNSLYLSRLTSLKEQTTGSYCPIPNPINPVHIFTAKSPKFHFNIILPPLWLNFFLPGKLEECHLRNKYGRFLPNYFKFVIHSYFTQYYILYICVCVCVCIYI